MSLLESVRQTISDAATTARDVGQNLGAQAQAQLQLRKLQIDQTRKLNELGARTYDWHRAGQLVATGQVPREVSELCNQLDDLGAQIVVETHKLEEAKRQAELRAAKGDIAAFDAAPDVVSTSVSGTADTFPAASMTTGTIIAPIATSTVATSATTPIAPVSSMPYPAPTTATPTTEPTIIPISTPRSSMEPNTTMQNTHTSNAPMPLTPAPPMTMPFPEPTTPATPSMTLSPMGAPGTYALVPGPDTTPPVVPGTPGPDTSPSPMPGGPGPDVSPPLMPPSGPGTPLPSSPTMPPPSPGSMPTM